MTAYAIGMRYCVCCTIAFPPGWETEIWHIHPRCPLHGRLQYRGLLIGADGYYYGACQRDHAIIGLHPVPCELLIGW